MKTNTVRALLVAGALTLCVLLFIAPKTAPAEPVVKTMGGSPDLKVYAEMATKNLAPEDKIKHDHFVDSTLFDSLSVFWNQLRRPDLAAYYTEKSAQRSGNSRDWHVAGNRYYYAVQFARDNELVPLLYQSAIRCFRKAVDLDASNTDAAIMLASSYVEGTQDPMKGISMLREIEKRDSNNVKLQISFAAFSVKSGQLDKAAERYRKALRADSSYIETYLHLADVYEQMGNAEATIEMLEAFAVRTDDLAARTEVRKYIEQLKKK